MEVPAKRLVVQRETQVRVHNKEWRTGREWGTRSEAAFEAAYSVLFVRPSVPTAL